MPKPPKPYLPHVTVPLQDCPNWLSHLEFYRDGNEIVMEIIKENGLSYGYARMTDLDFNNMADLILTRTKESDDGADFIA